MLKLMPTDQKPTDFDRAFDVTKNNLGDIGNKQGFSLYQHYRDFYISVFSDPAKIEAFISKDGYSAAIGDLHLWSTPILESTRNRYVSA